ncbi:MAG: PTS sugar transporter subunit IIA [Candidatus Cloacimonetes bacterium]|nr:PTS sugar transporter subunit IIA [Candidatus Cloacimonadota bacterium]MCF7813051.1 PTS sugar transporter subunit IIA [Candidatus Cloacimonadota bacterium]MCF7867208.1 PTS sugar transporter subunit IIA [Candidatus Cloacimonadota bacterium]MCF7882652.1 PTS sugar transporter subunit IIA [Candidatus Cloacimonadota bacterium]
MKIFDENLIEMGHYALDKKSCLYEMAELLEKRQIISSADDFFDVIMEREKLMSTGIGRKVAIPHARTEVALKLKIAVYLLDNELEYGAIDGESVKIIFMVAVPDSMKEIYMKVLSAISNFFRNEEKRQEILNCTSLEEMCKILKGIENEV